MKTFIAVAAFVVMTVAEPPPSNSYLPPSASSRNGGYQNGGYPSNTNTGGQGVTARGIHNGGAQRKFVPEQQGYDHNAAAFGRNALEEAKGEPANYNFGYMVNDYHEGTDFGHHEARQDETAHGEYHVVLPDGRKQTVSYEADEHGFKPQISYQDSDATTRSNGYDSNAANVRNGGGKHDKYDNGYSNGAGSHGNGRSKGY